MCVSFGVFKCIFRLSLPDFWGFRLFTIELWIYSVNFALSKHAVFCPYRLVFWALEFSVFVQLF